MKVGEVQEASGTKAATAETSAHRSGDRIRTLLEASREKREEVAKAIIECSVVKQISVFDGSVSVSCATSAHTNFNKYKTLRKRAEKAHATLKALGFAVDLEQGMGYMGYMGYMGHSRGHGLHGWHHRRFSRAKGRRDARWVVPAGRRRDEVGQPHVPGPAHGIHDRTRCSCMT